MNLHLFLWILMSICAILLLLENRRKDTIIKELREKPNDKPSWEEVTDKMETSKESIKEVIERENSHVDEWRDAFDSQLLSQIRLKEMFYKHEGLTTEQFEQGTRNYLRRMGFTKERLEHLGFGHLVRLL